MKKLTLFFALAASVTFSNAQGLQGIVVEKYYETNAADSVNAFNNSSTSPLRVGSITYRVFVDMAPGYKLTSYYGNQDALANPLHPMIIKTTTNFYNDPNNGQVYPQGNTLVNTKKNTTLIDSWLSAGGVCVGKMGVLKTEDTDGSIGNSNGVLTNNPGGTFGVAINSVVVGAQDGLLPGTPVAPNPIGITTETDIFDQTAGNTFSITNGLISILGGAVGTTTSNMVLIGQFTTNGVLCFSLNVQVTNTVTNQGELYVHNQAHTDHGGVAIVETSFPGLSYCSPSAPTNTNVGVGIDYVPVGSDPVLHIYPNPSKDIFILSAANLKEGSMNSYSVYDVMGKLVLTRDLGKQAGTFSEAIDMTGFKSGLYVVKVSTDGVVSTKRIIKE